MGKASKTQAETEIIKTAMRTGGTMTINGVAGRWNASGDEWSADDLTDTETVILVRISDTEEDEINGVARQVQDACALATRTGARARVVLVENDTSAFKRKKIKLPNGDYQLRTVRPKFRKALALLSKGQCRRFISYHLDRTVRDPRDLEDLIDVVEDSTPRIICDSVTGSLRLANDTDITSARIHCAIANQASRDTARRVSRSRRQQAEEGCFGGGRRPYGFETDGITIRPAEAQVIRRCADAVLAMEKVYVREIARDLNRDGIATADGKKWTAPQVRDMLLRPRNAGLMVYRPGVRGRKPYTPDDIVGRLPGEPIIEPDEYWSIVHKLTDPDRRTNHVGVAPKWFGSGIYRCPCGGTLRVQNKKYKTTNRRTGQVRVFERMVYRCQETGQGHVLAPKEELDALVIETLLERIRTSDPAEIIGTPNDGIDVAALRAELARHRAKLEEIAADYDDDLITRSQMLTRTEKRRAKIAAVEAKLAEAAEAHNPAVKLIGADDIEAAWDGLTLADQREILRRTLVVTVKPIGRGRRPDISARVDIHKARRGTDPDPLPLAA
jgi:DNA invertase Pin-like site-specific DNA recombinase/predicted amino acid-binding ACT domain protein